jgi:hypothetical protein
MWRDKRVELVDAYLAQVAVDLRAIPSSEVEEIVRELRGHILERLESERDPGSVSRILERLGDPRAIAREHLEARLGQREIERPAPRPAGGSTGFFVRTVRAAAHALGFLLGSSLAYGFALCWLFTALAKPFRPQRVGLWLLPAATGDLNLSLGSHAVGEVGRDLLGWWIVPLGLVLGVAVAWATWRWNRRLIHRWRSDQQTHSSAATAA